ncbi:uncharacterized protein CEXT_203421 [Caerostris extrusa]|uniref:VWFC domain-containing protein n=1 Tax=Caerostris extrusa TaxID=172846 RepID=A0AAV4R7W7_CAEEX|nr:uncharacterized protein CEXT_203421 [Caerostris extrusa]
MTTKLDSLITGPNVGQKTKKRRPGLVNKYHSSSSSTKPNQLGTGSALTLEEIYNLQTVSSDTNLDKKTFLPYATETITETYRRHTRPSQNKKISNGRRQPENSPETTILTKTTKPIPQDIAEFLWSITQTQKHSNTNIIYRDRIESDYLPEWSDDYEEEYYNSDHDHSTLSKIFNNIHTSTSVHIETSQGSTPSENSTKNIETSEAVGISATEAVPKMDNQESKLKDVTLETPEQREFTKSDYSKGEAEFQTTEKTTTEVPVTTETLTTTTPIPKTTYYTSTITTTTPEDTTKSFSGYVRNKYKGTSTHIHESEPKFFRADDDEAPTESPNEQEDSREITDVCFVEGRYYTSGETIIKSNPCEMCRCFYGHPLCQVQQCPPHLTHPVHWITCRDIAVLK